MTSSDSEDSMSEEDTPKINYIKNAKFAKKSKYQKYPRKVYRDKMNAIVKSQTDQITCLTK